MGALLDLLVLINSQSLSVPKGDTEKREKKGKKKKRKQMGFKNQPMRLARSGEGFGARKNEGDLGHELI